MQTDTTKAGQPTAGTNAAGASKLLRPAPSRKASSLDLCSAATASHPSKRQRRTPMQPVLASPRQLALSSNLRPVFMLLQTQLEEAVRLAPFGDTPASREFPYSVAQSLAWAQRRLDSQQLVGAREATVNELVAVANGTLLHLYRFNFRRLESEIVSMEEHVAGLAACRLSVASASCEIPPKTLLEFLHRHGPASLLRQLHELPKPSKCAAAGDLIDPVALLVPMQRLANRFESCMGLLQALRPSSRTQLTLSFEACENTTSRRMAVRTPSNSKSAFGAVSKHGFAWLLSWLRTPKPAPVNSPQINWMRHTNWKCATLEADVWSAVLPAAQQLHSIDEGDCMLQQPLLIKLLVTSVADHAQHVMRITFSEVDAALALEACGFAGIASRDVYLQPPVLLRRAGAYLCYLLKLPISPPGCETHRDAPLPTFSILEVVCRAV